VLCDHIPAACGSFGTLGAWLWHLKILTDLFGQFLVDFVVAGNASVLWLTGVFKVRKSTYGVPRWSIARIGAMPKIAVGITITANPVR
jgi:hypothetical protein